MNLQDKILGIIKENVEKSDAVDLESDLRNEIGIDSFEVTMIIDALEVEFGITIDETDFQKVSTASDIVALLKQQYIRDH
ncbi:MAG: acyl carrier protein [Candidatus Latescibacterota bacterium]|nr:MAG: acyl carrier protein [Candidatus Latescibacterota bacterium]